MPGLILYTIFCIQNQGEVYKSALQGVRMQGLVVKRRGEGSSDFRQPGTVYGHRIYKGRTSGPAFVLKSFFSDEF